MLGCTHFPLLLPAIRAVVGEQVRIVDSAATTAGAVAALLDQRQLRIACDNPQTGPLIRYLATDSAARFAAIGSRFLGEPIDAAQIELVDL